MILECRTPKATSVGKINVENIDLKKIVGNLNIKSSKKYEKCLKSDFNAFD